MAETILTIISIVFGTFVMLVFLSLILEDTETFKAIDERLAKWIRADRKERMMVKEDITYCDWLCPHEQCERNAYQLEGLAEQNSDILKRLSFSAFTDCEHYGKTSGMYVPMGRSDHEDRR